MTSLIQIQRIALVEDNKTQTNNNHDRCTNEFQGYTDILQMFSIF